MNLVKCENGHFYNADKLKSCPHCAGIQADITVKDITGNKQSDITPENLIIGTDNKLYLIDFGSAAFEDIGETENKTVILKPGFAPPEQYLPSGKLGAWTDVYGLCATMYYALTGITPADALLRQSADNISHISNNIDADKWQADVIMKGLSLHSADRYQSMDALYQAFIIPPFEMSTERKEQLDTIKHSKTIMPSGDYTTENVATKETTTENRYNNSITTETSATNTVTTETITTTNTAINSDTSETASNSNTTNESATGNASTTQTKNAGSTTSGKIKSKLSCYNQTFFSLFEPFPFGKQLTSLINFNSELPFYNPKEKIATT